MMLYVIPFDGASLDDYNDIALLSGEAMSEKPFSKSSYPPMTHEWVDVRMGRCTSFL